MRLVRHLGIDKPDQIEPAHAAFGLPFSANGRAYYGAVFGQAMIDHSFSFVDQEGVVATVACDNSAGEQLTRFGSAIEIAIRPRLSLTDTRTLTSAILGELREISKASNAKCGLIRTTTLGDPDGLVSTALLRAGAEFHPAFRAVADLTENDDALMADLRSHHRRQVRKGQNLLALTVVDQSNSDKPLYDQFRDLHAEVAGRVTRPLESWEAGFALIRDGQGALVMATMDGVLVGGTLALDAGAMACYASGAYRRDYFDKPISHYPLYASFALARARGRRWFDIGDTMGEGVPLNDKERHIADFKAGFTSRSHSSMIWRLPLL